MGIKINNFINSNENINVVSTEGVGSEFTFSLSKAPSESEPS